MFINKETFEKARSKNALLGFFFAQRTGSRALVRWLGGKIPSEKLYFYRNVPNFVHWKKTPDDVLEQAQAYAGFSDFVPRDLGGRPFAAFSVVRHPLFRIASLYEVSKRDKLLVYHPIAAKSSFEDFYRHVAVDRPYYFHNLCCFRIAGDTSFGAAQEAMNKHYAAVGLTDQIGSLTRVISDNLGWSLDPLRDETPDEEKYASYLTSLAVDEILSKNKDDVQLYEYIRGLGQAQKSGMSSFAADSPSADAPTTTSRSVRTCPNCGNGLETVDDGGGCPNCKTPARTRSLVQLVERVVGPQVAAAGVGQLPLLAFAPTGAERKILAPYFEKLQSVSLYGKYGADHMSGVDVRDMQDKFAPDSFSGAFGILLFDYFPEHEAALAELYRVIAPGGLLFTLILPTRIKPNAEPPEVTKRIQPRPGYFDYIPAGGELLNVKVGQDWLLAAIARNGFEPQQVRILDEPSGETQEWFIGFKPKSAGKAPFRHVPLPRAAKEKKVAKTLPPEQAQRRPVMPSRTSRTPAHGGLTAGFEQEFQIAVDPAFGFRNVNLKLAIPPVPMAGRTASFAEHRGHTVVAVMIGGMLVSEDLGRSWNVLQLSGEEETDFVNCFTTKSGDRLLQVKSPEDATVRAPDLSGAVYRYDKAWNCKSRMVEGQLHHWHGSCSIDQAGETIIWAEYPDNKGKYIPGGEADAVNSRVFRSRDGGATWEVVFSQTWQEIRHFHVVAADPHVPGQWWLSSGDRPSESRVWVSRDDGTTWVDVTDPAPKVLLHRAFQKSAQAVYRFTDIWLGQDEIIWGSDDWLGSPSLVNDLNALPGRRSGARMFRSPRTSPLAPRDAGWIGNPVRSITDLGPALLITTESKQNVLKRPQVYLMSKKNEGLLQELFTIGVEGGGGSGFTFSRASRTLTDGVMFSFRGARDLAELPTRIVRWEIKFD